MEIYVASDSELVDELYIAECSVDYSYREVDAPRNYQEAIISPEANKWKSVMDDEMNSLKESDTFELVPSVTERVIIVGRWVYAVKIGPDDQERFKARYVMKGYSK